MNRKIFYLHDQVVAGVIKPTWVATEEMDADIGTKQLKGSLYDYLSNRSFTRQHYEPDDNSEFEESPEDYAESDREDTKIMNQGSHEKDSHLSHKKVDSHTVFINPKIPINSLTTTIPADQPEKKLKTGGGPRTLSKDNSNDKNNVVKKSGSKSK
jgi:hypothetical protein